MWQARVNRKSKWSDLIWQIGLAMSILGPVSAAEVRVDANGGTRFPELDVPSSTLMSDSGNQSRVEHIMTERSLKGTPIGPFNAALFGPRLERSKAKYGVNIRPGNIGGVPVLIYQPKAGIIPSNRGKKLINVHGGGFVGCFTECGGLESIPVAALTGIEVISIDYRLAPKAQYPAASEDVAAVYRAILKSTSARRIGIFGCSAGGLLTAQSLAWFQSHRLPRPRAAGIFCAGGDASMGGDSKYLGMVLGDGELPAPLGGNSPNGYMRSADPSDINAYPSKSASVLKKFPPTLIIVGGRDFAFSSAVSLHARLVNSGVDARLHVWEGGRHAFFYDARVPEAQEAYKVMARFFAQRLN